jgi:ribosomal protein S18 acetylase RimI-like enzyme
MTPKIIIPNKKDLKKAARVLTEAFKDYPLMQYFIPDANKRYKNLDAIWYTECIYAFRYGKIFAVENELKNFEAVIITIDEKISNFKMFLCGAMRIPLKLGSEFMKRQDQISKIQNSMEKKHAKFPHRYLWAIATLPQHQGKGYGSILVQHILEDLKKNNLPCYLETTKQKNIKIYEKLGFKLVESFQVPDCDITNHAMIWDPSCP